MNSHIVDNIILNMDNNTLRNILLSMNNDSLIEVAINMNKKDIVKDIINNIMPNDFTEFNHNHIIKKIFEYDYDLYCYTIDHFNYGTLIINFLDNAYYMISDNYKQYLEPVFKNLKICERMMIYIYKVIYDEIYGDMNKIGEYLLTLMYKQYPKEWTKFMDSEHEIYYKYYNSEIKTEKLCKLIVYSKKPSNYTYFFKYIFAYQRVLRDTILRDIINNRLGHMISYFIPRNDTISLTRVYNIYMGADADPYCMMLIVKKSIKYNKLIKSYDYYIPKKITI